jgi:small subunit ribosomal protein S1
VSDEEQDFERMLEASLAPPRVHERGALVEGTVVAIGSDVAFVDVGGKGEATIDLDELADENGQIDVAVGDVVQALVVSTSGGLKLSLRLARGAASRQQILEAYRAGLPVEGRVERAIKGGYEVRIGGQRGFCPISQIDTVFTADPAVHEGRVYTFRITEYQEDGRRLVVSRRALVAEQEAARAEELRRSLVAGAIVTGRVASIRPYGAFVDLGGGVQGLLHVSEMSWARVTDPAQIVQQGQEITVTVLEVDEARKKLALGLKQLQPDPWSTAHETYEVGQLLRGRVNRLAEFGAFIELEPGIDALAHASTFAPSGEVDGWKKRVPAGASVAVRIMTVDFAQKRIGVAVLEPGAPGHAASPSVVPGAHVHGKVERHESYGVFVFLAPGVSGLMPGAESGLDRGADLRKAFPLGTELELVVLDIDATGRRIRLSRKAVLEEAEKKEAREYAARQDQQAPEIARRQAPRGDAQARGVTPPRHSSCCCSQGCGPGADPPEEAVTVPDVTFGAGAPTSL